MSGATGTPCMCEHCGFGHVGTCPRVKAIEYHSVKFRIPGIEPLSGGLAQFGTVLLMELR